MLAAERWQRVKQLFGAALERDPDSRQAFLAEACGEDADLRGEVENLLAHHDRADSFIELSAFEVTAQTIDRAAQPNTIGPYKIIREIARGGMGAVFLATRADDQYRKQVAIKLIKRGMDTDFIIRRFLAERQILANLDHPNIARLYDGGTTPEGLPYFVMEYVEGLPVDQFCKAHQLTTAERLKLFRQVCAAVHYAHQNLVIHRDLKPSNILVTRDNTAKLLDFGIAKLLSAEVEEQTQDATAATAARLMTPEYASPEQLRGLTVTTATDVYSLGVVLHELLTGQRLYLFKNQLPHEIVEMICQMDVEKPSTVADGKAAISSDCLPTVRDDGHRAIASDHPGNPSPASGRRQKKALRKHLSGDLDNIVMMAMRKEPARRYASVEQFSEDLRRHLEGLPVMARRDTFSYRAAKFIKRNKLAVAAGLLIVLTLIGGIVATAWQARVASRQQAKAERRFDDVRKLANAVLFNYHDAIEQLPGSTAVREMMITDALEYLDSLLHEAGDAPSLQRELAAAYEKVGDIQGNTYAANLNDSERMIVSYRKSALIREALVALDPANAELRRELANSYEKVGDALSQGYDLSGALEQYRKALAIIEELSATDTKHRLYLARLYDTIGNVQGFPGSNNLGDTRGAFENYRKAVEICQSLYDFDPTNMRYRWGLIVYLRSLGNLRRATGDLEGALEQLRASQPLAEAWAREDPNNIEAQRALSLCYSKIGDILAEIGSNRAALTYQRKANSIDETLLKADPTNARAQSDAAIGYFKLGTVLSQSGDFRAAQAYYRKGLEITEALSAANPANGELRMDLADDYEEIADAYALSGQWGAAGENYRKALAIAEALFAADPSNLRARQNIAACLTGIGQGLLNRGEAQAAQAPLQRALVIREEAAARDSQNPTPGRALARLYALLGDSHAQLAGSQGASHWQQARALYEGALEVWLGLRNRGLLSRKETAEVDRLTAAIARCDAARRQP